MSLPSPRHQGAPVQEAYRHPLGYERIETLSSAIGLTIPEGARLAIITPETQNVRWRDDGTNPTASVGMPMEAGDVFLYTGKLADIKFIETTASAVIHISYYR